MAGGGPGSHGSTKQNYDLDQIWGDLREGIEHVSLPFRFQQIGQMNQNIKAADSRWYSPILFLLLCFRFSSV